MLRNKKKIQRERHEKKTEGDEIVDCPKADSWQQDERRGTRRSSEDKEKNKPQQEGNTEVKKTEDQENRYWRTRKKRSEKAYLAVNRRR